MQTNLIDELERVTERSINYAGNFADPDWRREAEAAVQILIRKGEPFSTDEVWRLLEGSSAKTHEPRAMGAVMRKFVKEGLIDSIGYQKTTRRESHRRPIAVWRPARVA